jgi:hypothetical protein
VTETLDGTLKERLRDVLGRRTVTEAMLRKLSEDGAACTLILDARLARSEQRLSELSVDPQSSLAEIAAEARTINDLRPDLEELHELLAALDVHARELRAAWLSVR